MSPQTKREAEQTDEVCKRLKEDIKKDEEKTDVSNDNNNSTTELKADVTNGKNETITTESKEVAGATSEVQKNGEKKEDEAEKKDAESDQAVNGEDKKTSEDTKEEVEEEEEDDEEETDDRVSGTFLICGGANWDMTGRKELPKNAKKPAGGDNPAARNLWGPHRVVLGQDGKNLRVRGVFSGCNACHSVIVTEDGQTMTFGRNDKGQLGLGDTNTRVTPEFVEGLKGLDIVSAACGRSHTLFLTSEGVVYSCGDNKMGQCGTNQMSVHQINTPVRVAFGGKRVIKMACGAEFSMIVDEDGKLYSFGHPEYGQLGHNSEAKYFTSGNKYAYHCEYQPRRIVTWIEKSREGHVSPVDDVEIVDVACGTNHTLAVDKRNRCFSWGFAGYHRLGHSETKNEMVPRSIKLFDAPPNSGRGCLRVFAGSSHSMALDVNGLLYFWGQNKSSGEATMYPKNVQDLCGWRIRQVTCGNKSIFVLAEESCISWGPSPTYGELGYGEGKSKSSTTPQEVRTLENIHVLDAACGFGHTLLIARDEKAEDKAAIDKHLPAWP